GQMSSSLEEPAARSLPLTFRRFGHVINTDEVFGTHRYGLTAIGSRADHRSPASRVASTHRSRQLRMPSRSNAGPAFSRQEFPFCLSLRLDAPRRRRFQLTHSYLDKDIEHCPCSL